MTPAYPTVLSLGRFCSDRQDVTGSIREYSTPGLVPVLGKVGGKFLPTA